MPDLTDRLARYKYMCLLNFITEIRTYKITCASCAALKNSWKWCNLFLHKILTMFTNIHNNSKRKKNPLYMLNTYN